MGKSFDIDVIKCDAKYTASAPVTLLSLLKSPIIVIYIYIYYQIN